MRTSFLILIYTACCSSPALAQTTYFAWTGGAAPQFYPGTNKQIRVSFPYAVTDASGNTTQSTFSSGAITPYRTTKVIYSAINWELGDIKRFVTLRLAGSTVMTHFSLGYGQNFYFDLSGRDKRVREERSFVFKPSLNFGYNFIDGRDIGSGHYLGSIDNTDKTVRLLGMTSGPTYSYTDDDQGNITDSITSLDLFYKQHECVIIPKLSISNNQYKHFLHWEASIAYNLPVYEKAGLVAYQNDQYRLNHNGKMAKLDANGTTTTFGQQTISAAPYRSAGFYAEFTLGFCILKTHRSRRRRL